VNTDNEFKVCFTLDTEPDNLWNYGKNISFENLSATPQFHKRMLRAGAQLTYLTTSEVALDKQGAGALSKVLDMGNVEIGAHFHTWTREWPFEIPNLTNPPIQALAHQLGQDVEEKMLAETCGAIRSIFNINPKSFRGGRWSFGLNTPISLSNCGIEVDSTITPGMSWRDSSHPYLDGMDWRKQTSKPQLLYPLNGKPIVELPVGSATILPNKFNITDNNSLRYKIASKVYRSLGKQFGVYWLRPSSMTLADMCTVILNLKEMKVPVWVIMIHSSELIPCKPLPSSRHVQEFMDRCVGVVEYALEAGAEPATLHQAAEWYLQCKSNESK